MGSAVVTDGSRGVNDKGTVPEGAEIDIGNAVGIVTLLRLAPWSAPYPIRANGSSLIVPGMATTLLVPMYLVMVIVPLLAM